MVDQVTENTLMMVLARTTMQAVGTPLCRQ
jgi:hypothetical protein